MEQYIPKSAVLAEIENRIKSANNDVKIGAVESLIISKTLNGFKSFLNTLEVKEVNLEEKATQLSQKYFPDEENIWARPNIEAQKCKSACIEMVEWLKAQKGE